VSKKPTLKIERAERVSAYEPEGLKDGGHVYLTCSNCQAYLMDIFRTRPHEKEIWRVRCSCPWCGDKSFITEIKGGFHRGGYGRPKSDDDSEVWASTDVVDEEILGDVIFFHVQRANADAKPVYAK
jgi:hypothetical protein